MKMYEYLIGSLVFVGIWIILCLIRKDLYKEMLFCSFLCAPLGLTDAIFIPWYWNPGIILKINLFNLTFSIEGLIFYVCCNNNYVFGSNNNLDIKKGPY